MSGEIGANLWFREPGDRLPGVDQFWRCPKCEFAMGCGSPAELSPPRCPFHKIECEQVTEDGFYADDEAAGEDTTVYAEFCQVLAELEMLSHGTVTNYAASGGGTGADTRDPTGESPDDDYREYVLTAARVGHRYRRQDDRPWGTLAAA